MLGLTSSDGKNYWEVSDPRDSLALDAAKLRDFQALRREKYAALADALGRQYEAPYTADSVGTIVRSRSIDLDYLPPDARLKLLELLERQAYGDQSRRGVMRLATNGPGDHERQVVQRDAEIAALLGPAQFDEYLRRTSDVAGRLRYQLSAFRPTREEFDALLQIERERMIDAGGGAVLQDSVVPRFKTTTEEDRQQRLKAALGESRYAQYVRATDRSFQHLHAIAKERGLDGARAESGFARVEQARTRVARALESRTPGDPARSSEIEKIQKELTAQLVEDLELQDLGERESQALLGPALNVWTSASAARARRPRQ
jgi:hypothetical protein